MSASFAVLMAVYRNDNPALFLKALKSVFNNSIQPAKFYLVCDGPLSESLENVISFFDDQEILVVVRLPKNLGLFSALNAGLKFIKEDYTIRADSDDYNYPNRFEFLLNALNNGYDIVGSWIREVDMKGNVLSVRETPLEQVDILKYIKKRNPFNHMSVAFRTEVVRSVGGYPDYHLREDYALWVKMISSGCSAANIPEILVDATAGNEMYKRRGGIKYAVGEIAMQRLLVATRINGWLESFFYGLVRSFVFLAPNFLRKFIYLNILRKKQGDIE